jgi:glycosidase
MKQMMGNPEAVASAYSVYDYTIAEDLGGEEAFQDLRHRAWHRGIRLAGDMVPNHVGLHSKWVVEHPDYFVQTTYSPFPNYQFTGHNFSTTPGLELRIEDGYWTRRDAAVVFQRVESHSGSVRYIYHGNDGTSFPWNDTAQLDFLRADVREAVIGEIFHVAEKFSIIRFDAAMVLAKKHFQRLWYPEPGSGGDIPSRADHAMTKEEFDRAFPVEFWREVVDRINRDKPSTLLLAEAFWLLEGYFVRTLGMHRVYNSAFMHMMMKEENAKYRELIYNTLAFNPEILKRYVNFMSNPDEKTAVEQFGKEDKYFGIAMVMVTLPGLPMFAHGQIEGFTEKYGMEYQRAYYDESPDSRLVARHEREIFPLLKMRHLFSQVAQFELYNFLGADGSINENVFVYSNDYGGERALVCYNNRYES